MSITREQALAIADEDAKLQYRDLSIYKVAIGEDGENWRVDYELVDQSLDGGGPHYVISATDGRILDRRYEQ